MQNILEFKDWELLFRRIKDRKCTPFLGTGVSAGKIPVGSQIASEWAEKYGYPMEDSYDLKRVAQFVAVTTDPMAPKEEICKKIKEQLKEVSPSYFEVPDEIHGVLADLPLPVYITTTYDDLMERALESRGKTPNREICRWNKYLKRFKLKSSDYDPTPEKPLVFHLYGCCEIPESLVLTEDDYQDFLTAIPMEKKLLPPHIQEAFADTSLLFLGYRIADWDFHVLSRILYEYLKISHRKHYFVQFMPGDIPKAQKEKALEYLDRYFADLDFHWQDCREFAAKLRTGWEVFKGWEAFNLLSSNKVSFDEWAEKMWPAEKERIEAEKERIEKELAAEKERAEKERIEKERAEKERIEKELAAERERAEKKRWAIIVGISKYKDKSLNLRYADRDAEEVYKLLRAPAGGGFKEDHIKKLINEEATNSEIIKALRTFLKKPCKDDIVIIYFACHGSPDPERPKNIYLLPHDTDPNDISGTALPMREIDLSLKEDLDAESVVIIADTCHSAAIGGRIGRRNLINSAKAINAYLQEVSKAKGGVALLTSAEANESSQESELWGGGHGVFTYFLLQGMLGDADGYKGQPKDGKVTVGELFEYVRDNVMEATNYTQHPAIGTNPFHRDLQISISSIN